MEGRPERIADYFVVVGVGNENISKFEQFSSEEEVALSESKPEILEPISDIAVLYSKHEQLPKGYWIIESTPQGHSANLSGSIPFNGPIYICYKKGKDKLPITDIGVFNSNQNQSLPIGHEALAFSIGGRSADLNKSGRSQSYLTIKRGLIQGHNNAITDLCIVASDKGEEPPACFRLLKSLDLSKGLVGGHTLHLCYRTCQVRPPAVAYTPELLSRYPVEDHAEFPLPHSVPLFCLPFGVSIEHWERHSPFPFPAFSTFALTNAQGQCMYGAVVVFYEAVGDHKCGPEMRKQLNVPEEEPLHMNKCICLLSHWPFFPSFKRFLSALYRLSISHNIPLPLERYIGNLMLEVPFPTLTRPRIQMHIGSESIVFSLPVQTPLPLSVSTHWSLLSSLDPDNCLILLSLTLLEQKLVLHSSRPALLTCVGEALRSILFPFSWQCTYIPLCPLAFSSYMQAPVPFIIGIDSHFFDVFEKPAGVAVVDLDANTITMSKEMQDLVSKNPLPSKPSKVLKQALQHLIPRVKGLDSGLDLAVEVTSIDYIHTYKFDLEEVDVEIREAFLRFFAAIIGHYRKCLTPLLSAPSERSRDASTLFNQKLFLKNCSSQEWPFFRVFFDTQIFNAFIEQRSFAHTENSSLVFFDECTEKVKRRPSSKLVNAVASINRRSDLPTVVSLPPDDAGMPQGKTYSYPVFPTLLDPTLFCPLRLAAALSGGSGGGGGGGSGTGASGGTTSRSASHSNLHTPSSFLVASGSPMVARRTPAEKAKDKESMERAFKSDSLWSKCLLSHVCSLWYILLPAHLSTHWNKMGVLSQAMDILEEMRMNKALPNDEVCYRILMQQCVNLRRPALAVRVYHEMIKAGIQPNAVTYGFYNKAVLEGAWPSQKRKWKVLLITVSVCLYLLSFKKKGKSRLNKSSYPSRDLFGEADFSSIACSGSVSSGKSISALDVGLDDTEGQLSLSRRRQSSHKGNIFKLTAGTHQHTEGVGGEYVVRGDSSYVPHKSPHWGGEGGGAGQQGRVPGGVWSNVSMAVGQSPSRIRRSIRTLRTDPPSEASPSGLSIELSSCNQCSGCRSLLYDEDIMSGWSGDEANYMTTCPYCSKQLVASLTITTKQTLPVVAPSSPVQGNTTPPSIDSPPTFLDGFSDKTWPRRAHQKIKKDADSSTDPSPPLSGADSGPLPKSEGSPTHYEKIGSLDSGRDTEIAITSSPQQGFPDDSDTLPLPRTDPLHRRGMDDNLTSISDSVLSDSPGLGFSYLSSEESESPVPEAKRHSPPNRPESTEIMMVSSALSVKSRRYASVAGSPEVSSNHMTANDVSVPPRRSTVAGRLHRDENTVPLRPKAMSKLDVSRQLYNKSGGVDEFDMGGVSSYISRMKALGHKRSCSAPMAKISASTPFLGRDEEVIRGGGGGGEADESEATRTGELPGYKTESRPLMVVPYLSPVVLRKEVESLISLDGTEILEKEELVRDSPIIYWNLVWYFSRLELPTYLPLLSLWDFQKRNEELVKQSVCMRIDLLWDMRFNEVREPLYLLWLGKVRRPVKLDASPGLNRQDSESQLQSLVARTQCRDIPPVLTSLLRDRLKRAECGSKEELVQRSIYREILFLYMTVSGQVDIDVFDREYMQHIQRLPKDLSGQLHPYDYPPSQRSAHCRRNFGLLHVK